MKAPSEDKDPNLDRLSLWLKESSIQPAPDFLHRVRQRIQTEAEPVDEQIDQFLKLDPALKNPNMVNLVRSRLRSRSTKRESQSINWFSWIAPLAAAATLTLAFISFQTRAPDHSSLDMAQASELKAPALQDPDQDVTRIFALAANLHSSADMSKLQSVEDLASLFD